MPCGVDGVIFKTNENFGGDTITYSIEHITTDGAFTTVRVWLTHTTRPI